jgi:hypothetical protein
LIATKNRKQVNLPVNINDNAFDETANKFAFDEASTRFAMISGFVDEICEVR